MLIKHFERQYAIYKLRSFKSKSGIEVSFIKNRGICEKYNVTYYVNREDSGRRFIQFTM